MAVGSKAQPYTSPASAAFGPLPGPEDLAVIHRLSLEPLPAERLYVRRMSLANTRVDRTYERFTVPVLERLGETLVGKSLLVSHDTKQLALGLIYRYSVEKAADGESDLVVYFFLPVLAGNEEVRQAIDAGVIRYCSIGFRYDQRICDICGGDYYTCPHFPGDAEDDGSGSARTVTFTYGGDLQRYEAREASLVYLGAQVDAQIIKEFQPMENEKALARIKELEAELAAKKTELASVTERVLACPKLEEALGKMTTERDTLREQLQSAQTLAAHALPDEEAKALCEDGKLYRADLRAEVARLAGIVKTEAEASLLLTALPHAPAKQLKELVTSYQARADEKFPPRPHGEPPAPDPADPSPVGSARPLRVV